MDTDEKASAADARPEGVSLGSIAVRGSLLNSAQWLVNKVLTAGSMLLLAHWLSPVDFGVASQASAIVQFMAICLPLTLGDVVLSRARRTEEFVAVARSMAIKGSVLNGLVIVICIPVFLAVYRDFPSRTLGLLVALLASRPLLEALQMEPLTRLRARLAYGSIAVVEGVSQAISTAISLVMALLGGKSVSLIIPNLLGGAIRVWCYRAVAGPQESNTIRRELSAEIFRDYVPAASAQYLHKIASTLEVLVLGIVCGELETGLFAFSALIATQANTVIAHQLGVVLQPIFGFLEGDVRRQAEGLLRAQRVLGLVCVPIALVQVVMAEPLFRLLFSSRYQVAVPIFQAISLAQVVLFALGPQMAFLRARRRFDTVLKWQIAQLVVGVLACWAGARLAGATGVAIGYGVVWGLFVPALGWLCLRGVAPRAAWVVVRLFAQPLLISLPAFAAAVLLHQALGTPSLLTDTLAVGLIGPLAMIVSLWIGYCVDLDLQRVFKHLWGTIVRRIHSKDDLIT